MIFPFVFVGVYILTKLLHITAHILHITIAKLSSFYCTLLRKTNVGYTTVDSPAGGAFKALSLQFEDIEGKTSIPVVDLVKVANPKGGLIFAAGADQIWTYDISGGWNKYYYRTANKSWCRQGETVTTTDVLDRTSGTTIFFRRGTGAIATTLTLSGAVKDFEATSVYANIAAGTFRFISYPWPQDFPLNNLKDCQSAPKGGLVFAAGADQVWTYDVANNKWVKYFYSSAKKGYVAQGGSAVTDAVVSVGDGFFFRRATGGSVETITFDHNDE